MKEVESQSFQNGKKPAKQSTHLLWESGGIDLDGKGMKIDRYRSRTLQAYLIHNWEF